MAWQRIALPSVAWALALALSAWPQAARADEAALLALSPRAALSALPSPPAGVEEARARWEGGVDRAVEPVRRGARIQLAQARLELGRAEPFDRDPGERRAAAGRLGPGEVSALLALEQAHAAEPVQLSRNLDVLAREKRLELEEQAKEGEQALQKALATCGDEACRSAALAEARKARVELLSKLLEATAQRWALLKLRFDYFLAERQRLAERVATASSDPYVRLQAQGLLADAWRAVAELADEVEKETALAARLASSPPNPLPDKRGGGTP